jgi:putative ABC transport system substrate-binding protein
MTRTKWALLHGTVAALACLPLASPAAPPAVVHRIGWLAPGPPLKDGAYFKFLARAKELGYVEGRNLVLEYRAFRLAEKGRIAARELVRANVELIIAQAPAALSAAHEETRTIPIVALYIGDPIRMGVAESLAHPGGNVTGFTWDTGAELAGKRLQLVREIVPGATRVAILWDRENNAHPYYLRDFEEKARPLGLSLLPIGVARPEELEAARARSFCSRTRSP